MQDIFSFFFLVSYADIFVYTCIFKIYILIYKMPVVLFYLSFNLQKFKI